TDGLLSLSHRNCHPFQAMTLRGHTASIIAAPVARQATRGKSNEAPSPLADITLRSFAPYLPLFSTEKLYSPRWPGMFNSANVPAIRSTSPTSDRLALYDWNVSFDLTSLRT